MIALLLAIPWAYRDSLPGTGTWAYVLAAIGALLVVVWTAWMGIRQARKRAEKIIEFRRPHR